MGQEMGTIFLGSTCELSCPMCKLGGPQVLICSESLLNTTMKYHYSSLITVTVTPALPPLLGGGCGIWMRGKPDPKAYDIAFLLCSMANIHFI